MPSELDATTPLVERAIALADAAPTGMLQTLAQVIAASRPQQWSELRLQLTQILPQQHLCALAEEFLGSWHGQAPRVTPQEAALVIRTAALTTRAARERQSVELVWTGPTVRQVAMRRTDQALLEVIQRAQQSLLIVSFAVYNIPAIAAAIVQAAARGVTIQICVEAPEPSGQKMAHDTVKALGPAVAQQAAIYVWPSDQRPVNASGHAGVLHVKCAVSDAKVLFLSSANLTDSAFNRNMELGLLLAGGAAPSLVVRQFAQLIESGVLKRLRE